MLSLDFVKYIYSFFFLFQFQRLVEIENIRPMRCLLRNRTSFIVLKVSLTLTWWLQMKRVIRWSLLTALSTWRSSFPTTTGNIMWT